MRHQSRYVQFNFLVPDVFHHGLLPFGSFSGRINRIMLALFPVPFCAMTNVIVDYLDLPIEQARSQPLFLDSVL